MNNIEYKVKDGYFSGKENLNIYYRQYIVENNKASIVICHGVCESADKYKELIRIFNKNRFSVYILEHRGHGRSSRLGIDNSQIDVEKFEYYVDDLKTFIDNIVLPNNKKLFIYSHSMGGAIATMFLEKYNNYFDCAILSAPMMEINTGKYPVWFTKVFSRILCIIGQGNKYLFGHKPFTGKENFNKSGTSSYKRYIRYFNKQIEFKELQTYGQSFHWLDEAFKAVKYITNENNVKNIKIPILLFQAGKDTFVKSGGQNKFASYAKNCRVSTYEESKHELYFERDEIFNRYIKEVLEFYNSNI